MAIHNFKTGDTVYVINRDMSGEFFLEGRALIAAPLDNEDRYLVRFIEGRTNTANKRRYERYVDPLAQDEPFDFLDRLNAKG